MVNIFLDAGHGGKDSGAVGHGLKEKDITLRIVQYIRDMLANYEGVNVMLSRASDKSLTLEERVKMSNRYGADLFISVHINAGGGTGFESFIYNGNVSNKTVGLHNVIHSEITRELDFYKDRGKKRANFHVLRETKASAILTECGFIDSGHDTKYLKDSKYLIRIAHAHVKGIEQALGIKKKESVSPTGEALFRVIVNGDQVGAFGDEENVSRAVEKYLPNAGEIVIKKIRS